MGKHGNYEEYRDTGACYLGSVPSSWEIKQLKRSVEGCVNGAWGQEPTECSDDIVVIRVADFDRARLGVSAVDFTMRSVPEKDRVRRRLRRGDLLLEKSGGGENQQVGQVVLFDLNIEAVTSNFVARLRPLPGADGNYLNYAFSSLYRDRINTCSIKQNTGIQNLDSNAYLAEQWAFPSLKEQKQIAAFLDYETAKIDALIEKQQQLIALLGEKRQAVISHAVTKGLNPDAPMRDSGVEWLGEVPQHWTVPRLGYVAKVFNGSTPSRDIPRYWVNEGVPWVASGKVNEDVVTEPSEWLSKSALNECSIDIAPTGSVVIGMIGQGATRAMCAMLGIDTTINQNMAALVPDSSLDSTFLYNFMTAAYDDLRLLGRGANQPALNCEILTSYKIALPPIEEQVEISNRIRQMTEITDRTIQLAEEQQALLQERRTALISAAVTGKIDVRGWKPPSSAAKCETEMEVA